jgi:hypothetical protein
MLALLLTLNLRSFAQGPLMPPGPPAPTMKTLEQVEPRKPITAPATISQPGSYYLTTNATVSGNGITITSSNIALDLGGFTLTGDGGMIDYGILINPSTNAVNNVSVRNGKFVNFAGAVIVGRPTDNVVIEDIQMNTSTRIGIWLAGACKGAVIRRNLLVDCVGGIYITAFSADVISGVTIEHNTVTGGTSSALEITAPDGGQVRHIAIRHNHFSDKSGTAVVVSRSGTGVAERLIFDSNYCSGNGNLGMILPTNTLSVVVRNFFVNLTLASLLPAGNTVGPIISTSGFLGTNGVDISPWANIRN